MTTAIQRVVDESVVSLAYVLRDSDGELIDQSNEGEPLEFIQGYGQIIDGLESQLYGMAVGDEKSVIVAPEDGYGEYDPDAHETAAIDSFPPDVDLEVGMPLELYDDESGETIPAYIAQIDDDGVVIDFNHPLAGEELHFHVTVVGLRAATRSELEHGHVHSADDHHD